MLTKAQLCERKAAGGVQAVDAGQHGVVVCLGAQFQHRAAKQVEVHLQGKTRRQMTSPC